jgi:hypothetical protein
MRFGRNVRLVVSFPKNYNKLDLDNYVLETILQMVAGCSQVQEGLSP